MTKAAWFAMALLVVAFAAACRGAGDGTEAYSYDVGDGVVTFEILGEYDVDNHFLEDVFYPEGIPGDIKAIAISHGSDETVATVSMLPAAVRRSLTVEDIEGEEGAELLEMLERQARLSGTVAVAELRENDGRRELIVSAHGRDGRHDGHAYVSFDDGPLVVIQTEGAEDVFDSVLQTLDFVAASAGR